MEPRRRTGDRAPERPLPAFFYRLSGRAQRTHLRSDSIDRFAFAPSARALELARSLIRTLETGAVSAVNQDATALVSRLCRELQVPPVRIEVREVRPHNARGELHGIFYPARPALIVLWMRTARRREVVKPRTFLRTLLHELAHYLDYALLRFDDSFHTGGFFKRESFLVRALYPQEQANAPAELPHLHWDKET